MRRFALNIAVAIGAIASMAATANAAPTLNFTSDAGTTIHFDPTDGAGTIGSFDFTNGGAFTIGSTVNGTDPDTPGLSGTITGTFDINDDLVVVDAATQTATVSGTGAISITDENGDVFTADVEWVDITTQLSGLVGQLNINPVLNLSNVAYAGTNTDLLEFLNAGGGVAELGWFAFANPRTLTQLTDGSTGENSFSFQGALSVPAPSTAMMLLTALPLIGFCLVFSNRFAKRSEFDSAAA
jgi:hypothetical protein